MAVLDDEEAVRKALKRLLRSAGFGVETFASGAEFLDSIKTRRPDCLVLDLHMPHLGGFEVQARLAQAGDKIPIVAITGYDAPETRERVLNAGAAAYLRKPVDDLTLLEAIAAAVAQEPQQPPSAGV